MIFQNRQHAGKLLAQHLLKYSSMSPVVLALPRGGVPVAAEISKTLKCLLDVLVVRKIGTPFQSELAVGALCEDSEPVWSELLLSHMGLGPDDMVAILNEENRKVKKQIQLFREGRDLPSLTNGPIIVVDDGLATGATMSAALKYLRKKGAQKLVVAVPVAALSSIQAIENKADEIIVIEKREELNAVSQWYWDFSQVSNEEVLAILRTQRLSHETNSDKGVPKSQERHSPFLRTKDASGGLENSD
jgi:putative phosphoribosyl transferase